MGNGILWAACGTGFAFLLTSLGSATVFFMRTGFAEKAQKVFFGFAAGVMVAASVWSMLIPGIEDAEALGRVEWIPAGVGFLSGGVVIMVMDWLLTRVKGDQRDRGTILFLAVTLHNVPEGMAVGLAFALAAERGGDPALMASAIALAVGIGLQNFPEGAALSLPLCQGGRRRGRAFGLGVISAAVEPVAGVLAAMLAHGVTALMPWMLSFAAGAMMYVVLEEMLPEAASRRGTLGAMAGFVIMMLLDVALG